MSAAPTYSKSNLLNMEKGDLPTYSHSNLLELKKTKFTLQDIREKTKNARENSKNTLIQCIVEEIILNADKVYHLIPEHADKGYDNMLVFTLNNDVNTFNKQLHGEKAHTYLMNAIHDALRKINIGDKYSIDLRCGDVEYDFNHKVYRTIIMFKTPIMFSWA